MEKYVCLKCGSTLEDGEQFCSNCGTERDHKTNIKCKECGTELDIEQKFCPKCGTKVGFSTETIINKTKDMKDKIKESTKKNRKPIIFGGIGLLAVIVIVLILCVPNLIINKALSNGDYEKAYKLAKGDRKDEIALENIFAYISKDVVDSLKDSNYYDLRDAWYDEVEEEIVLSVGGKNSYGGVVENYWYYTFDDDDNMYTLYTSISDFDEEEVYSWDDYSDIIEKYLENAAKEDVREIINDDSLKVDDYIIDNINELFKNGKLDNVEILEVNKSSRSSGDI